MKMKKLQKNLKFPALWTWLETVVELAFLTAPKVSVRQWANLHFNLTWMVCESYGPTFLSVEAFSEGIQLGNPLIYFH